MRLGSIWGQELKVYRTSSEDTTQTFLSNREFANSTLTTTTTIYHRKTWRTLNVGSQGAVSTSRSHPHSEACLPSTPWHFTWTCHNTSPLMDAMVAISAQRSSSLLLRFKNISSHMWPTFWFRLNAQLVSVFSEDYLNLKAIHAWVQSN